MKKRSQTVSTDVIFAIMLFLFGFILFFHIISQQESNDLESIKREGNTLPLKFIGPEKSTGLIVGNRVDKEKLKQLSDMDYEELKQELNLKYDFCMYFEDEQGNIIDITKETGKFCIGSPDAKLNGIPCG